MTQVSEDAAFVRYPPPALSQRARGFQPLLLVKVAGRDARALSKSLQKRGICGALSKSWQSGEGIHPLGGHNHPSLIVTRLQTLSSHKIERDSSANLSTFSQQILNPSSSQDIQ